MTQVFNIFDWLDNSIGDDSNEIFDLFEEYRNASRRNDAESVRSVRAAFVHLARTHNHPWLEVFGRHWELQFRLNERMEGASAVADAVAAFEIAHRPENIDCPQTICSAQDLSIAFTRTDGPGYAQEVIAACQDTLARIDPTWPCYDCVSAELRQALVHAGRNDEAIELIDEVEVEIRRLGENPTLGYEQARVEALLARGDNEEALRVCETIDHRRFAEHNDRQRPIFDFHRGRALVRAGHPDEALAILAASPNVIERPSLGLGWIQLVDELLASGDLANDDALSATKVTLAFLFHQRGSYRDAFNTAVSAAVFAARRGAVHSALRAQALAVRISADLVKPADAPDRLAQVAREIEAAPSHIADSAPLDAMVAELEQQRAAGELDADGLRILAAHLTSQGWSDASGELLWERVRNEPADKASALMLASILLNDDDEAGAEELAEVVGSIRPLDSHWILAQLAAKREDWAECAAQCRRIVEGDASVTNTRRLWALAERNQGDIGTAAQLYSEILDRLEEDSPGDWWTAVGFGSMAQNWPLVRRAAACLGFEFESDSGPVEELWEGCYVTFVDDDGVDRTHFAQRTGPATARVLAVAPPGRQQRFNDVVAFQAQPLDTPPEDPEERVDFICRYAAEVTLSSGGFRSFAIEGVFPDPDVWANTRTALDDGGFPVWSYDVGTVQLSDDSEADAMYTAVAVPEGGDLQVLDALLHDLTADWPFPPSWRGLAEELGYDTGLHEERLATIWGD